MEAGQDDNTKEAPLVTTDHMEEAAVETGIIGITMNSEEEDGWDGAKAGATAMTDEVTGDITILNQIFFFLV